MREPPRILIVEDEQIVAEDLREVLEKNGFLVQGTVASGEEALRSVVEHNPNLILMDIHLSGVLDGIETAKRVHAIADIPVIFLTSFSTEGYVESAKITNPYGYITKPFDPQTIITTLEIAISKHSIDIRTRANLETYRFIAEYTASWEMWCDPEGIPVFVSPSCERITGYSPSEIMNDPGLLDEMVFSEDRKAYQVFSDTARVDSTQELQFEYRIQNGSGDVRWIEQTSKPLYDATGKLRGRRISNIDVTREHEQIQRIQVANQERDDLYFSVAETMKDTGVLVYDLGNGLEYINPKGAVLMGKSQKELLNKSLSNLSRLSEIPTLFSALEQFIELGSPAYFESSFSREPGGDINLETWLFSLKDDQGQPRKIWAIVHDVSEKRRADQKILQSLKEKEILLKEIHHRVKNNLQQVASLLYLQERRGNNQDPVTALQESRNRIYSMALAHEILYTSADLADIPLGTYVRQLVAYLKASYGSGSRDITIQMSIDPGFSLPIDECIICGIIINELVSNAMKHAFRNMPSGKITIDFHADSDQCLLVVRDDGAGIPDAVNFENPATLGLLLIRNLVHHMEGTISLSREKGTAITIAFPRAENRK